MRRGKGGERDPVVSFCVVGVVLEPRLCVWQSGAVSELS